MSFGKKSSSNTTPQPTFTQPAQPTTITRTANSAEAQDRVASSSDPQSSLLSASSGSDEEELKRRNAASAGSMF